MRQAAAPLPRAAAGQGKKSERAGPPTHGGPPEKEQIEEGQILIGEGVRPIDAAAGVKIGSGRNFGVQSRTLWQVKSAENRAAGAGTKLRFHQKLLSADSIEVSEDIWSRTSAEWMWTLVGWIFGTKPSMGKLKGFVESQWGDEGVVTVSEMKPGIFVFKFAREYEFNRVLALGPWSFDSRQLVLKQWSPDENYELQSVASLPIWVRFPGLNLHLRSEEILSMLASTMGKPIRTDGFTASFEKLSYARVLVEVYASNELKKEVCIIGPRGTRFYQRIQYEWVPPRCIHCQSFGHSENQCKFPVLRIDEEDEVGDSRMVVEPEGGAEEVVRCEATHKAQGLEGDALKTNRVQNREKEVRVEWCSSFQGTVVPETAPVGPLAPPITEEKSDKENEMKDDDDDDEKEDEENEEEEEEKKEEPMTPNARPASERKTEERYSLPSVIRSATPKSVSIDKCTRERLSEIPNVAYKLSKKKPDDNLQLLHTILFGKKVKVHRLKRNIGQFSGFVWSENEGKQKAKVKEKIDKCAKEKLVEFCYVLDIPINKATAKKEEISMKLMEFLQTPLATTDALLADADQKNKVKRKATRTKADKSSGTPTKKPKTSSEVSKNQKSASKLEDKESEEAQHEDEPSVEGGRDIEKYEGTIDSKTSGEDEPKPKLDRKGSSKKKANKEPASKEKFEVSKETTPAKLTKKASGSAKKDAKEANNAASNSHSKAKGSTSKKLAVEKEKKKKFQDKVKTKSEKETNKSPATVPAKSKGKGKAKKSEEPTIEEMHPVVVNILKEVDFNIATLSDILRHLGTHFDVDLLHRKAEVKDIIREVISNMTDDEDEE